jgi:hypothetical protein
VLWLSRVPHRTVCHDCGVSERASQARQRRFAGPVRNRAAIRGPHKIAQRFRGVVLWGAGAERAVHVRSREGVIQ